MVLEADAPRVSCAEHGPTVAAVPCVVVEGDEVLGHVSSWVGAALRPPSTFPTNGGSPSRHRQCERARQRRPIGRECVGLSDKRCD